ncbi:MAG: hypothetical protein JO182_13810 [Acidobacteriaceae bacterium]|nr:hypothetical protein [Acidobacteriaceae bacterium]
MTRKFFNLTGRAAVLASLLLGLILAAGIATAQDQSSGAATGTPETTHGQSKVLLRIMVFAHAPVVGADVRVSVRGRLLVHANAATNEYGVFPAPVGREWLSDEEAEATNPSERHRRSLVRITISGGTIKGQPFPGHLMADVPIADLANQILVVNPVTTLVSRLLDARPELDLNQAQARVRSFLTLPANYPLGQTLRQGPHYRCPFFSPAVFVAEAEAAGGLDAFAHLLLQELAVGLTHSFRPPPVLTSTTSDPLGTAASVIQAGLYEGLLDYAGANNVANLTGWAMSLAGLPSGSSDDIDTLESELQDIVSSIGNLSSEVGQLNSLVQSTATQTQYNDITNFANQYAVPIQTHETNLEYFSNACKPLVAGSTPATPDPTCTNLYNSLLSELQIEDQNAYYELVQNYVKDNGTLGTSGMLHLYSLWLGQSKHFFRAADSTHMQNLYDYWDSILTSAANLRVEYYHIQGYQNGPAGIGKLTGFMAPSGQTPVCVATPTQPIIGAFQCNETANSKLIFPAVPAGTVINTTDHQMWSLVPWVTANEDYGIPDQYVPAAQCWSWNTPFFQGAPYYPLLPYAGFNDWAQSPNKSQWQALVQNAPSGSNTPNWMTWLIQQTQTTNDETPASPGFFNWTTCPGIAYTYAWTSTNNGGLSYWYINPLSRSFGTIATNQFPHYYQQNGTGGIVNVPIRTLVAGEQYFWYQ